MQHYIDTRTHPPHFWKEPATDPYRLLHEFFDYTTLHQHRLYTNKFIDAAYSERYAIKGCAGHMLEYYEKMQVLFYVARLIHDNADGKDKDIGIDVSKLNWDQLPHSLAHHEIKDPYIAIEEIFEFMSYDQWLLELHLWFSAALHHYSVLTEVSQPNISAGLLHKLADALWMIYLESGTQTSANLTTQLNQQTLNNTGQEHEQESIPTNDSQEDDFTLVRKAARSFFDVQPAANSKEDLWRITKLAVCHPNDPDPIERDNMIYLYELLCGLIDVLDKLNTTRHQMQKPAYYPQDST